MKTILQAIKDKLGNAIALLTDGEIEEIIIDRNLNPDNDASDEIRESKSFIGARADCLYALVPALEISESDISLKLKDPQIYLRLANELYASIGEEQKMTEQPKVYVGPPPGTYASY